MGNQKLKWKSEEEEALRAGVAKHGTGKWKIILDDPEFSPFLTHRSNIDLKDKWRNLSIIPGVQGSRDKSRVPKVKETTAGPISSNQIVTCAVPLAEDDSMVDDPSKCPLDGKLAPRYNAMIFEALSSRKDANGSDISAIVSYIEQRHAVPQNFRKLMFAKLRRLVLQGKLEKVHNCYKIKDAACETPKRNDLRPDCCGRTKASLNSGLTIPVEETLEDAAMNAAYKVAEAENKSFVAAEAVKEADRISKMAENAESLLQLVTEIYEECSRGKVVLLA